MAVKWGISSRCRAGDALECNTNQSRTVINNANARGSQLNLTTPACRQTLRVENVEIEMEYERYVCEMTGTDRNTNAMRYVDCARFPTLQLFFSLNLSHPNVKCGRYN